MQLSEVQHGETGWPERHQPHGATDRLPGSLPADDRTHTVLLLGTTPPSSRWRRVATAHGHCLVRVRDHYSISIKERTGSMAQMNLSSGSS